MHHAPIKAIDYATDVIREFMLKTSAAVNDVNLKSGYHLIKLLMVIVFQFSRESVYNYIIGLQCNSYYD